MPWSKDNGGSGGGWKGGGGGGGGPWGQGPGGPNQPPDIEEMLKRSQDRMKQVMKGGSGVPGGLIFLGAALAAAVVGFYAFFFQVNPGEQGIVMRFGQFVRQEGAGLHFKWPPPFEEVQLLNVTNENIVEVGTRTQASQRNNRYSTPVTPRDMPEESLMLTSDENIVDIDFVVLWSIANAENYLFSIERPDDTVKDVAESAMREIIGRSKIGDVLAPGREPIEIAVKGLMQDVLDSYKSGVKINQIKIQQAQAPAQVRAAFEDVISAIQDRDRAQNEARGYANKVIPEARGEAQRILQAAQGYKEQSIADATGQTARFLSVYEQYKKAPDVTRKRMYLETMEGVMGSSDKIIIDSKAGNGVVPYLPLDQLNRKPKSAEGEN
ncbi:MAG: FtsH protease activity modulator HflK [Hyphomicrobium sp.]|mgnify:CR=1 FL=1